MEDWGGSAQVGFPYFMVAIVFSQYLSNTFDLEFMIITFVGLKNLFPAKEC